MRLSPELFVLKVIMRRVKNGVNASNVSNVNIECSGCQLVARGRLQKLQLEWNPLCDGDGGQLRGPQAV